MNNFVRRSVLLATVFGTGVLGITGVVNAQNQADPPARVGRLAFAQGTVSFHDAQDANWTAASVNDALTTGDSLWTEPNARSEVSVSGTRVRLDQSTQLDMLQLDDSRTRMQLGQGRLDIKTFSMDTSQPYEIVTPRGTVKLEAQGDYYVEAGTTDDPTRLGVRSGAAQITGLNGQVLAVRAGEVGEISGDAATPQLHTIQSAPPPMPTYWAQRDQQINYDQPQYVSADVVGYEDLQAYGAWSNDPDYGQVWSPSNVGSDWQPYYTGSWAYSQPYGWTWVDEQPWGFAPYHYGRWANRNNRWFWVPPERRERAVYAPALVAFVGGAELSMALGGNSQPVGWFPLGPREAYVPPYTNDRAYYDRINTNARVERAVLDDRWNRAERHEAIQANQQNERMVNRRFTTVVPAAAFIGSQHANRTAIKVSADKIANTPVAAVSAPPPPTQSMSALKAGDPRAKEQADLRAKAEADAKTHGNVATANTRFNGVQELARPQRAEQQRNAPGPKIATTTPTQPNAQPNAQAPGAKPNLPPLEQRRGAPPPAIQGERTQGQQPNAAKPGEPNRPNEANRAEPNKAEPNRAEPNRTEPPKPGQAPAPQANRPEPSKPGEVPRPPQAEQRPGENARPLVAPAPNKVEAPKPPQAQPEPPRPAENKAAPPPQRPAEPPRTEREQPAPQRPAENHVTPPPAAPRQVEAPRAAPPAAPQAQPQHVQAPPPAAPPQVQHAPAPPPPQHVQAPPPAPRPAAPPPQAAAPHPAAPPPPAPHPAAPPPQQAQAPHPAPAPAAPAKEEKK